jgi:hypothetical protein
MAVTGSLSAASLVLAAGAASADTTPNSQAEGRFLDGSAGALDLNSLANLAAAQAENNGGPTVTDQNPLTATVLNSVVVPIGPVDLLGPNGILDLGAVNQIAIARADGSSVGASGAVTNDGAIDIGGSSTVPGDATLELGELLDGTGVLTDLDLRVGALSARATQAAGAHGNQDSSYQIADLVLTLDSTVVSGLLSPLLGEQSEIDGITGLLNLAGLGVVTTSPLPNLATIVSGLGTLTSSDGSLGVNLSTGVITVDLEQILDLNHLAPNTPLLPYIQTALTTQLVPTVQAGLTELAANISTALDGVTASADLLGVITPVPAGVLSGVVDTVFAGLTLSPAAVGSGLFDNAISGLLDGVLALTANVQAEPPNTQKPAGSGIVDEFTVTALRVNVLDSAAIVDLASASVGSNFGPTGLAAPVATGIDPDHGPVAGGTVVTITGTGFEPGSTVSVDGGPPITPDALNGNGTAIVYTAPAHAAGPVGVTVTTPAGTTAPLTYTYVPADGGTEGANHIGTPTITDPGNGDETEDTTPPISGVGAPGATVTVREGTTVLCTAVVRANRRWSCTPGVALPIGSHTITANQKLNGRTSGTSAPVTFRIVAVEAVGGGGLPATGAGVAPLPLGVAGLALVLTGLALTAAQRRVRQD